MAANFISTQLSHVGVTARIDRFFASTPKGSKLFANVSWEWANNPTGKWVVVVSHFDTKAGTGCPGANDGASTSGLLVALARMLCAQGSAGDVGMNYMLMWLDGEECMKAYGDSDGLWGSKRAASELKKSKRDVAAVICLDMLGDKDLDISLPRNTSARLRKIALESAAELGLSHKITEIRELVKDDHLPFLREGFPAIDLIDFEYGTEPGKNDIWHTPQDTVDKISPDSLLMAGRILCEMIKRL